MKPFDFDLFVIGAGSGGVRAARMSARHGARVAIAEERYPGGTCVNAGCVPKKLFVHAAGFGDHFALARSFGWSPEADFDWRRLVANKDREIGRLNGVYRRLLDEAGVTLVEGRAVLRSPHEVVVGGQVYRARHILLAVGGWPTRLAIPGAELAITSNEVFHLDQLPRRAVIVGGGYIAVEFAGIFHGLGVETHLVHRGSSLLKAFDRNLGVKLAEAMSEGGIQIHFDTEVAALTRADGEDILVSLGSGAVLTGDLVMFATGRRAMTTGLGLEHTGVQVDSRGNVLVNDRFQTHEPSIYALGDVIGRVALTPVAIREAMVLADNLFAGGQAAMDYSAIPTAVFSSPPLASVGLTEAEARSKYPDVAIYQTGFKPLVRSLSDSPARIYMKLVVDRASDRVLGCHMLGDEAAEIVQGLAVALKAGATKADFDQTVGIHPTIAEEFVTMRD